MNYDQLLARNPSCLSEASSKVQVTNTIVGVIYFTFTTAWQKLATEILDSEWRLQVASLFCVLHFGSIVFS